MAVMQRTPPVATPVATTSFYAAHRKKVLMLFSLLEVSIASIGTALIYVLSHEAAPWVLPLVAAATAFLSIITGLAVLSYALRPLQTITTAIAHKNGEKLQTAPPNPNHRQYQKEGTKSLLEAIYGFSSDALSDETRSKTQQTTLLPKALQRTRASVIIMDHLGTIFYHSANAPVKESNRDKLMLDLVFDNGNLSLKQWLKECRKNAITAENIWTRVHTVPGGSGKMRIFDVAATFMRDSDAEVTLVLHDRTDQYEPDEKDLDFIAFAAHELRGPITVIRGYLDVLADDLGEDLTDEQRLLLGRLVVSANRLTTYVNNILNVSRYDRRHYRIDLTKQNLYSIYNSMAEDMLSRATAQNRILNVAIDPDLPAIAADPSSISEVFANLIDNAIKYSNEGGIINVNAEVSGEFVEVSVQDHGIGMPDSVVRNLFHKFYRSHRSRESVAGSGIGLYISKAIVESHGGSIHVASSVDRGSTFSFSLPTYESVEEKLKKGNNGNNQAVIEKKKTWISNHTMYRG
jgi:signal transduction histidine kinase